MTPLDMCCLHKMVALLKHRHRLQCNFVCLSPLQACISCACRNSVRLPGRQHVLKSASCMCRNVEIEAQIAHLRAELLHKEQENDRVQLQLTQEKEERERAQRKVIIFSSAVSRLALAQSGFNQSVSQTRN